MIEYAVYNDLRKESLFASEAIVDLGRSTNRSSGIRSDQTTNHDLIHFCDCHRSFSS
jgi:hypothetical protein